LAVVFGAKDLECSQLRELANEYDKK